MVSHLPTWMYFGQGFAQIHLYRQVYVLLILTLEIIRITLQNRRIFYAFIMTSSFLLNRVQFISPLKAFFQLHFIAFKTSSLVRRILAQSTRNCYCYLPSPLSKFSTDRCDTLPFEAHNKGSMSLIETSFLLSEALVQSFVISVLL